MSKVTLNRRALLRGTLAGSSVMLGLPLLDIMLDGNGEALANGQELPTRFGVWFWGNGVRPESWVPTTTGSNWTPNIETNPLLAVRDYVSVASGCEIKSASHPHHSGMAGIMTGQSYHQLGTTRDTIVSTFATQSVDQQAADYLAGETPFRSVEIGITKFRGTDEGSTFQHLSHNGINNFNPSEYQPISVYERLFGLTSSDAVTLARKSVLDAVSQQVDRLNRRIGVQDRQRLEQHLESIRALEQQLTFENTCDGGALPGIYADINGQEQIAARNQIMSQLMATALACDLTRVFSVMFSTCGSGVIFSEIGAVEGLHSTCHTEAMPQPTVHAATTATMGYLSEFLQALRNTPEGTGNLLDNCSILCTTELSDGYTHSNSNFPILIAGLGGGRLKGNYHYASPNSENTSNAVLTALQGAGVPMSSFGAEGGYSNQAIPELLS